MIKSARVMKKAVAHLIPFMEEERALRAEELKAQGLEITEEVRIQYSEILNLRCSSYWTLTC